MSVSMNNAAAAEFGNLEGMDPQLAFSTVFGKMNRATRNYAEAENMLLNAGFTRDMVARTFECFWRDASDALDAGMFVKFYNGQNNNDKADVKGDGRGRSYSTKAELALEMAANMSKHLQVGLGTARFSTEKDDLQGHTVIVNSGGELIVNGSSLVWNKSPKDMATDILAALQANDATREQIVNRYVNQGGKNVDVSALKKEDHRKVEDMFFDAVKLNIPERFPSAVFKSYEEDSRVYDKRDKKSKDFVISYDKKFDAVLASLDKFNKEAGTPDAAKNIDAYTGKFFADIDEVTDLGNIFGGETSDGKRIPSELPVGEIKRKDKEDASEAPVEGTKEKKDERIPYDIPKGRASYNILRNILINETFAKDETYANLRANALVRMIDLSYAKDISVQEFAVDFLKSNDINGMIKDLNAQIVNHNKALPADATKWKKITSAETGITKETDGSYTFNIDNPVLAIRRKLVSEPPFSVSDDMWRKTDEAYATGDKNTLERLNAMATNYIVGVQVQAASKGKNFANLNNKFTKFLSTIEEPFDLDNGTWGTLDQYIKAVIRKAHQDEAFKKHPDADKFFEICDKIEDFIKSGNEGKPLDPTVINDVKTLTNFKDLFEGMSDDMEELVKGHGFDFNADDAMEEYQEVTDKYKASEGNPDKNDIFHKPYSGDFGPTYVDIYNSEPEEACKKMEAIINRVSKNIADHYQDPDYLVRYNNPKSYCYNKTCARINKVETIEYNLPNGEKGYNVHVSLSTGSEIITDGVRATITDRADGSSPGFEEFLAYAAICKEEDCGIINVETSDHAALYDFALAAAMNGLDYRCTRVTLSPEEESEIKRVRNIALRHSEEIKAGGTNENVRKAVEDAEKMENSGEKLRRQAETELYGDLREEHTSKVEQVYAARRKVYNDFNHMNRKGVYQLVESFIEKNPAYFADDTEKSEFIKRFKGKEPTPADIKVLADWSMKQGNKEMYDLFIAYDKNAKLQEDIWNNPTPAHHKKGEAFKVSEEFLEYQKNQQEYIKARTKEILKLEDKIGIQKYPDTADMMKRMNERIIGGANYDYVDATVKALIVVADKAKHGRKGVEFTDQQLKEMILFEQARQQLLNNMVVEGKKYTAKIDSLRPDTLAANEKEIKASKANYQESFVALIDDLRYSTLDVETVKTGKSARTAAGKLKSFNDEVRKLVDFEKRLLSDKDGKPVSDAEKDKIMKEMAKYRERHDLNLDDLFQLTKVYAEKKGKEILSCQDLIVADQSMAFKEIENAHNEIQTRSFKDKNLQEIAFFVFALSADDEVTERRTALSKPTEPLLDAIDKRSVDVLHGFGVPALNAAKSIDDLKSVNLTSDEVAKIRTGLVMDADTKKSKDSKDVAKKYMAKVKERMISGRE